jgi:hypothetical protein
MVTKGHDPKHVKIVDIVFERNIGAFSQNFAYYQVQFKFH